MSKNLDIKKCEAAISSEGATIAKIIATICVVYTHSYKVFTFMKIERNNILYLQGFHALAACGVCVFFLISGYFLTYKGNYSWGTNIKKKIKSLAVPYCLFIFVYACISCIGSIFLPNFFDDFRGFTFRDWVIHLVGIPFVEAPHFYGPLWFLRDLFIMNVFSFMIVPTAKKIPTNILITILIIIFFLPISHFFRYAFVFFVGGGTLWITEETSRIKWSFPHNHNNSFYKHSINYVSG